MDRLTALAGPLISCTFPLRLTAGGLDDINARRIFARARTGHSGDSYSVKVEYRGPVVTREKRSVRPAGQERDFAADCQR